MFKLKLKLGLKLNYKNVFLPVLSNMLKILRFDKKIVKPLSETKAFSGIFHTVSTCNLPLSVNNFQQAILSKP